jgi:hypothetical protein
MFTIVVMGIALTTAVKQWKLVVQREQEADLLAKGIEIQNSLALYSATMKAGRVVPGEVYPQSLAELTRPPKPFLRKVYLDPMNRGEWDYLRAPTGGIMGVRSKSTAKPIRKKNFPLEVRHFEGRPTYNLWVFQHPNPSGSLPGQQLGTVPPKPPGIADPNQPLLPGSVPAGSAGALPPPAAFPAPPPQNP